MMTGISLLRIFRGGCYEIDLVQIGSVRRRSECARWAAKRQDACCRNFAGCNPSGRELAAPPLVVRPLRMRPAPYAAGEGAPAPSSAMSASDVAAHGRSVRLQRSGEVLGIASEN